MSKLKILQVCKKFPYPPKDGESVAMFNMLRSLQKAGHEVVVMAMNTKKHYVELRSVPLSLRNKVEFHAVDVNTDVSLFGALRNLLFSSKSYNIERFISSDFHTQLDFLLTNEIRSDRDPFDIIQLEGLYLTPYIDLIRQHSDAPIVLRAHNVEFEIWERLVEGEENPFKRVYFKVLAQRLKKFELAQIAGNRCDAIVPITSRDGGSFKKLGAKIPIHAATAGIDFDEIDKTPVKEEQPSVFFIGALDWKPNQDGLRWFLNSVWPKIHKRYPKVKFYIAGRRMPESFNDYAREDIVVLGEVDDAHKYMKSKSIMVVPLFSGSGMRIKIIEGMALKRPIVATKVAIEGISYRQGEHLYVTDNASEFADRVSLLIEKPAMAEIMGERAFAHVKRNFDNQAIIGRLVGFYEGLLAARQETKEE